MSNRGDTRSSFNSRRQRVVYELVHYLNSETDEAGSLILNWNALKEQFGEAGQREALDDALEYFQDPLASYARDDELLRNGIERVLSDIMDNKLPDPIATPSTTPDSSSSSLSEDGIDDTSEAEGSTRDDDSETQTVQIDGDSEAETLSNSRHGEEEEEESDDD